MDPESLSPSVHSRSRCRCLDACLIASIISLFLMLLGTVTAAAFYVKEIKELKEEPTRSLAERRLGEINNLENQMQNVAYLDAVQSELKNGKMKWGPRAYGTGSTVGAMYTFKKHENTLQVHREGSYFLYANVNLTCTAACSGGAVTVRLLVGEQQKEVLQCQVELPEGALTPQVRQCFGVAQLKDTDRLHAQMELKDEAKHWKLSLDSGFGIFLVEGLGQYQVLGGRG